MNIYFSTFFLIYSEICHTYLNFYSLINFEAPLNNRHPEQGPTYPYLDLTLHTIYSYYIFSVNINIIILAPLGRRLYFHINIIGLIRLSNQF